MRGVSNLNLYHLDLYVLKILYQAQQQQLIRTLISGLNSLVFEASPLKARILQIQRAAATNISILTELPIFPEEEDHTYLAQAIKEIHSMSIRMSRPDKHGINWKEQFLNYDLSYTVSWKEFHNNIGTILRGRIPKWFIEICEIIAKTDNPTHKSQTPNLCTLNLWQPTSKKGTKQKWVLAGSDTYSKVSKSNELEATIVHWIEKDGKLLRCKGC